MKVNLLFDGPPSHESGRFVESEDEAGRGVSVGTWSERPDGLWALTIDVVLQPVDGINPSYDCAASGHILEDRSYPVDRATTRRSCVIPGCGFGLTRKAGA